MMFQPCFGHYQVNGKNIIIMVVMMVVVNSQFVDLVHEPEGVAYHILVCQTYNYALAKWLDDKLKTSRNKPVYDKRHLRVREQDPGTGY